ncbi:MAG TPA: hypothetical protein EYO58_06165 [Flavobacteriales bacterium]|nr:hypothetical protein [Flavobacteriales bacterium]HIB77196.1 hypothetical protein [Flavobacteriales bacterium]
MAKEKKESLESQFATINKNSAARQAKRRALANAARKAKRDKRKKKRNQAGGSGVSGLQGLQGLFSYVTKNK